MENNEIWYLTNVHLTLASILNFLSISLTHWLAFRKFLPSNMVCLIRLLKRKKKIRIFITFSKTQESLGKKSKQVTIWCNYCAMYYSYLSSLHLSVSTALAPHIINLLSLFKNNRLSSKTYSGLQMYCCVHIGKI